MARANDLETFVALAAFACTPCVKHDFSVRTSSCGRECVVGGNGQGVAEHCRGTARHVDRVVLAQRCRNRVA